MMIRQLQEKDICEVIHIWNQSVEAKEVVYKPLNEALFNEKFLNNPSYDQRYFLVAEDAGKIVGFINGICKKVFLPKETHENTPGFITVFFVEKSMRKSRIGSKLLEALMDMFRKDGKKTISCSGNNPINLDWIVPGTAGHDHNNAPGMDQDCLGYNFLLKHGFEDKYKEVAMYLDLNKYVETPAVKQLQEKLRAEGIETGRYDVSLQYEFDGMCDRVGSEYWRSVLQDETAKANPRPILAATVPGHIVGFTGPVDKQESGRGWFTGICTDPLYEKKGIATVLFNLLMQEFIAEGASFSTLFTGDSNHAQRLYNRTGFDVVRRFVVMSRSL